MKIFASSPHLTVNEPYNTSNYMSFDLPNHPSVGMVWYNTSLHQLQVFDGSCWNTISSEQYVDIMPDASAALDWAIKKMNEESRIEKLAQENEAVKNALTAFKKAEEQLKIISHIAKAPTEY